MNECPGTGHRVFGGGEWGGVGVLRAMPSESSLEWRSAGGSS
jgi:hypothetical protein